MRTSMHFAWPMLLVSALAVVFFVGGVVLEFEAADHGLKKILDRSLSPEILRDVLTFQNERVQRIQSVASAALDLAKIGLGAVVVLATQHITQSRSSENP